MVINIMDLWQLLHFATSMNKCMLLAFKNPDRAQLTTRAMGILNIQEECGLNKHIECSITQVPTNQNKRGINYLSAISFSSHYHNGFMFIGTLGHTHVLQRLTYI